MKKLILICVAFAMIAVFGLFTSPAQAHCYRGHYGGWYGGHVWHDTSHWDYHPGGYVDHGDHLHYYPGHYDFHHAGHWDHYHW